MPMQLKSAFGNQPGNVFFRCVEDSDEAIMISDRRGTLIYVNPAWTRIYKYTQEEALGNTPALLHSGMQEDSFYRSMWADIGNPEKGTWKGELINKAKDGTLVPVLLTITPYRAVGGNEILGYMGIAVDLTQKKQLERQILRQDRLASLGLLASGLAHEIGTPLGVVRGRAEFLGMKYSKDVPGLQEGLHLIVEQIDRISKLISSLLRLGQGGGDAPVTRVNVRACVEEVLGFVGQNLRGKNVAAEVEVPADLCALADPGRLQQIILNLLINALHAIGSDGRIRVRAGLREGAAGFRNMRAVGIEVEDSGCGIPPENLKKIFEPFFTTKDVGQGTGLGLSIVLKILQEMNGDILVGSEVGKGTTFTIFLPECVPGQGSESPA